MKILFKFLVIFIICELVLRSVISLYHIYYAGIAKPIRNFDDKAIRIVCVGESTTYGYPIPGNGYPEQLETLLNKHITNKRFKVYNLGVCAITSQEVARHLYKDITDYKPQLVIILVGNNNNNPRMFYNLYIIDKLNRLKIVKLFTFSFQILYGLVRRQLQICRIYSDVYLYYEIPNYPENLEREHEEYLEYMVKVAKRHNCKIVICNYFNSSANNFLQKFVAQRKLPFCNNEKAFKEYEKYNKSTMPLISEDGWHPSYKGYSIIAKQLFKTIIKYNLL